MIPSARQRKFFESVKQGNCKNVRFEELCSLVEAYGFTLDRVKGSHHIFLHPHYRGIVNIQRPHRGPNVARYICRQVLGAVQEIIEIQEITDYEE